MKIQDGEVLSAKVIDLSDKVRFMVSSSLWSMLFNNDNISKWATDYCLYNKDYQNEEMRNIIYDYGNKNIGNIRITMLHVKGKSPDYANYSSTRNVS